MAQALHLKIRVSEGHRLEIVNPSLPEGDVVDVFIVLRGEEGTSPDGRALLARLQQDGFVGDWADRKDIPDSPTYARILREKAQNQQECQPHSRWE